MKKRMKKLELAKDTLRGLEGRVVEGGYPYDIYSLTAGLDVCICPRRVNPGGATQ